MKRLLLGTVLATLLIKPLLAEQTVETSFTYTGLYKSLKTSKESDFSQLKLNFLLLENTTKKLCPTDKVMLGDGENHYQVMMNKAGALLLPLDKGLKKDHAAISFHTKAGIGCHLSMQISVAEFELTNVDKINMQSWFGQFENLYSTLAGWPGRYFMPSVTGLNFYVSEPMTRIDVVVNGKVVKSYDITQSPWYLKKSELDELPEGAKLTFSSKINNVLPQLEK